MAPWITDAWQIASHARWWAGPVFDLELRVASRQGKYYLLRSAYVGLLALVIFLFWSFIVRLGGGASAVAQVSRLSEAGKRVIITIVWFQFIAGQILATVLLSDAISGEVRQRTWESLLVTPIHAIHVVLGKLLSRLLHVLLLVAISLPVLAVTRVFGGVPWDYISAGLCITLSAAVFAGALSLLCSILYRHAYHAVLIAAGWYVALWGLDAIMLILMPRTSFVGNPPGAFLWSLVSPLHALFVRTQALLGGSMPVNPYASLSAHCLTILLAAAILLMLSAAGSAASPSRRRKARPTPGQEMRLLPRQTSGRPPDDPGKSRPSGASGAHRLCGRIWGRPCSSGRGTRPCSSWDCGLWPGPWRWAQWPWSNLPRTAASSTPF